MVEIPYVPADYLNLGADFWINQGVSIFLSTLVGGLFLIVIVEVFSHIFGESVRPVNAFFVTLVVNAINFLLVLGLLSSVFAAVPFGLGFILVPILVWILLVKVFFSELAWPHALAVGLIGYAATLVVVPLLTGYLAGFIPV